MNGAWVVVSPAGIDPAPGSLAIVVAMCGSKSATARQHGAVCSVCYPSLPERATLAMTGPLSRRAPAIAAAAALLVGCSHANGRSDTPLTIFTAGALARPLRAAADSFARVAVALESAGSLETARKITDLGEMPDVVAVADTAIFSSVLAGRVAQVTP